MWDALPTELCGKVLTYVSLHDLFTVRAVSWRWRNLAERQTFYYIRDQNMANTVEFGNESSCIQVNLYATQFDAANGVITFECREQPSTVLLAARRSGVILPVHPKFMTIHFEGWTSDSSGITITATTPEQLSEKEKERYRLHSTYNYAQERALELPSWDKTGAHLVGDHDHILSFAYLQSQSYHTIISSYPLYATFHWLKVSLSWLAAGLAGGVSQTPLDQIFASRYNLLSSQLAKQGCFKYDVTSEPVLRYITNDEKQSFCDLVEYIRTHDMETRLSRLQHALPAVGVDYRMIWKYPFAKAFVTGRALLLSEDDVIRGIEGGEQECKALLQSVSKRRNCERVIREQQQRRRTVIPYESM
jgi:F-box-like